MSATSPEVATVEVNKIKFRIHLPDRFIGSNSYVIPSLSQYESRHVDIEGGTYNLDPNGDLYIWDDNTIPKVVFPKGHWIRIERL